MRRTSVRLRRRARSAARAERSGGRVPVAPGGDEAWVPDEEPGGARPRRTRPRRGPATAAVAFLAAAIAVAFVFGGTAPADLGALRRSASEAMAANDCRSAADSLVAVAERDTQDVEVRKALAACYRRLGRYGDAERQLVRAVHDDPTAGTYFDLAGTRLSLGRRAASWDAIQAGADAATATGDVLQASTLARSAGNPELAKAILHQVEASRRDDRWLAEYAAAAFHAGDPDYGDRYQQAIDAAPDGRRPTLLVELGDALRERGRLADSLAVYLAVADDAPGVDQRHRMTQIGDLHFVLGRPIEAVEAYQSALDAGAGTGDTSRLRMSLARALVKAGLGARARSVLDVLLAGDVDPSTRMEAEALRRSLGGRPSVVPQG